MSKDLEILKYQTLELWFKNFQTLRELHENPESRADDYFLLGVIVGKREERKRKAKASAVQTDNTINDHIKSLIIDEIKSPDALMLVNKYLEVVRQKECH